MPIFKYALRNITRTKGRSILIGIIVVIISFSLCIGLCIRQSAANAKEDALEDINITAQISPDRGVAMEKARDEDSGEFDKSQLPDLMESSLSLDELQKYAEADSVKSFYYIMSASVNGSEELEAYSTFQDNSNSDQDKMDGMGISSGDFTIEGYSSDEAMEQFVDGSCSITEGQIFDEGTSEMVCVVSSELAEYNSLAVGDVITVTSPDDESESYNLEIVGIYENSQSSAEAGMIDMGKGFTDPANYIYTSYETLNSIVSESDSISGNLNGIYVLGDLDAYEKFTSEVADMGLSDSYVVSSSDLTAYEQSAQPLDNLAKFAGYFLIVIVLIGAAILIVLNIFATRERKYEIGVLTAIGMKKKKVAKLFMTEILVIALAGVIIGGGIGAAVSVPVTNTLLASQIESQQNGIADRNEAFGREFQGDAPPEDEASGVQSDVGDDSSADSDDTDKTRPEMKADNGKGIFGNYITEVSSAVDVKVLLELLLMGIALAVAAGLVSVVAIMRYEPLQILSNRD